MVLPFLGYSKATAFLRNHFLPEKAIDVKTCGVFGCKCKLNFESLFKFQPFKMDRLHANYSIAKKYICVVTVHHYDEKLAIYVPSVEEF